MGYSTETLPRLSHDGGVMGYSTETLSRLSHYGGVMGYSTETLPRLSHFRYKMGDPHPPNPGQPPPMHQGPGHPAATSKVGGSADAPKQMRTFAQILADEKENRNILEIKLTL